MNKKTSMGITVTILLILLLARFTYFAFILFRYDHLVLESVYLLLNYSLITLVIRIHKSQLHLLNFDRNSMFLFILLGVTYAVFFVSISRRTHISDGNLQQVFVIAKFNIC